MTSLKTETLEIPKQTWAYASLGDSQVDAMKENLAPLSLQIPISSRHSFSCQLSYICAALRASHKSIQRCSQQLQHFIDPLWPKARSTRSALGFRKKKKKKQNNHKSLCASTTWHWLRIMFVHYFDQIRPSPSWKASWAHFSLPFSNNFLHVFWRSRLMFSLLFVLCGAKIGQTN